MPKSGPQKSEAGVSLAKTVAAADSATPAEPKHAQRKIIKFEELAKCGDEVWIEHRGNLYRLQRTRQDRLILTK